MTRIALGIAAAMALAVSCGPVQAQVNSTQSFPLVEQGRYLTIVGDCMACHTAPGGKPLAGGRPIETPFGILVSSNITPDRETGIGSWSEEKFYRVMHEGHSDENLYPAMPYPYYTKTTRDDVAAIRAYLNTLDPVVNRVHANQLPFPFDIRASMAVWNKLYFDEGTWQDHKDKSAEWNRGGYLEGLAHCGACHTPKTLLGGDNNDRHLQGYSLQGWYAPDITNNAYNGLGGWSVEDIVEYLKTGTNRFDSASGPMAEAISDSTRHFTISDLRAIATYLKDQPGGKQTKPQPVAANDPAMQASSAIYADQCAACHTFNGNGIARFLPTLNGSAVVQSAEPTTLLRVVIDGTRAVSTQWSPTGAAMPAFGWKLSDDQIAAVLTFIRNSWGNAATPVSAGDVKDARHSLEARAD